MGRILPRTFLSPSLKKFLGPGFGRLPASSPSQNLSNPTETVRNTVSPAEPKQKDAKWRLSASILGSAGRIRTYNQLVNSELRYRCATAEYGESIAKIQEKTKAAGP